MSILISVFVGSITFSGSSVAMGKLQGWIDTPGWTQSQVRHGVNIAIAVAALVGAFPPRRSAGSSLWLLVVAQPAGHRRDPAHRRRRHAGGDLAAELLFHAAAAAAGFVVGSQLLIVAGAMVSAAGLILTQVIDGTNRPLVSVLFGGALGGSVVAAAMKPATAGSSAAA